MSGDGTAENRPAPRLRLSLVSAADVPADPADEAVVTLQLINAVESTGAEVVPVYDGQRGAGLFEIATGVLGLLATPEVFVAVAQALQPMLARMFGNVRQPGAGRVTLSLETGGLRLALEADDVQSVERMSRVAERFAATHAAALAGATVTEVTIRAEVAASDPPG